MNTLRSMTSVMIILAVTACADQAAGPADVTTRSSFASAAASSAGAMTGFGFNGEAGLPTTAVLLTGGGSFSPATASNSIPTDTRVHAGGGFSCIQAVNSGPLANCEAGQGVRWDTVQLLASTTFRCIAGDVVRAASTGDQRVVLVADFYRAGDGIDESFTAQMIVSTTDLADDIPGEQNLWIQGVGCGSAIVHFSR